MHPSNRCLGIVSFSRKPIFGERPFHSASYFADDDGQLRPEKPKICPFPRDDSQVCRIRFERWRHRVFGPGFSLCGMRCLVHAVSFTIYPPGWTPYGRKPIAPLDHLGGIVQETSPDLRWRGTVFDALLDGAIGRQWPEEVTLGPAATVVAVGPCRRTQCRHIAGAMQLFGLDARASAKDREAISRLLRLDFALFHEGDQRIRDGPLMLNRGREGAKILAELPVIVRTVSGLFTLGQSRGYWGPSPRRRAAC